MKINRIIFLVLAVIAFYAVGCSTFEPTQNPLEGWKTCRSQDPEKQDVAIRQDYKDYIQRLSDEQRNEIGNIGFSEDDHGQHAVKITVDLKGSFREHVLIYDKNNKRIKVIKYTSGRYRS